MSRREDVRIKDLGYLVRIASIVLRRSATRWLAPIVATGVIANVMLRNLDVLHEMGWAVYNAHFATVLLAPLVAAIAVIDGVRGSEGREVLEARGPPQLS